MNWRKSLLNTLLFALWMLIVCRVKSAAFPDTSGGAAKGLTFAARGVVLEIKPDGRNVVICHEAISNYMAAMTMPFPIKDPGVLDGVRRGDKVSFQLHVAGTNSWVDHVTRLGTVTLPAPAGPINPPPSPGHPLLACQFTNELGQAVSLSDFHGQALAITFFYSRCPLPDYCPRLSKNFQMAQQKLESRAGTPANWHLLSISFDPEFDTPAVLKAYGDSYQYDPKHWSFLTGPADKIGELARAAGLTYQYDAGAFNHDFRTLIIDAAGRLQMVFPTSGDLSDPIVAEIIMAAGVTNRPVAANRSP